MTDPSDAIENLGRARRLRFFEARLASSLGFLVIRFNRLESGLGELLAVFLRHKHDELFENISIMTAALSFSQKLDLLSALYLKRHAKQKEQCALFKALIAELSEFEEYRNTCLHSRWGTHTYGDEEFLRFKSNVKGRKGLREISAPADWKDIRKISREMESFAFIEMVEIYRGCVADEPMPAETITILNDRATARK